MANVPEGLLPTITLALAVGVRDLARRGALVKRLLARSRRSGSTTVICTDKTGTLTQNRMRVTRVWLPDAGDGSRPVRRLPPSSPALARAAGRLHQCRAVRPTRRRARATGDPTELALLELAAGLGADVRPGGPASRTAAVFQFDPRLKLMTTGRRDGERLIVNQGRAGGGAGALHHSSARRRRVRRHRRRPRARSPRAMDRATPSRDCACWRSPPDAARRRRRARTG